MANGDVAVQAGLSVMQPTRDLRLGADDINGLLDVLVNWLGRQGGNPSPISKGGTGGTTAADARAKLGITLIENSGHSLQIENDGRIHSDDLFGRDYAGANPGGSGDHPARLAVVTSQGTLGTLSKQLGNEYLPDIITVSGSVNAGTRLTADDDIVCTGSKDRITSYGALHIDSNGKLGTVASAAKYKTDVAPADLDVDALLAIEPKTFRLTDDPDAGVQLGFIADDFEAIAPQLVIHGDDGEVEGLHYERVSVALYAIARSLHDDLATERRRTDQLDRRTRWLYEHVTGQQLPAEEEER